jgi:hypothetical protein
VFARWWPTSPAWLPWGFAAALLTAAAIWDKAARGGSIDFVLIGLAGYELVMGLTEERQADV